MYLELERFPKISNSQRLICEISKRRNSVVMAPGVISVNDVQDHHTVVAQQVVDENVQDMVEQNSALHDTACIKTAKKNQLKKDEEALEAEKEAIIAKIEAEKEAIKAEIEAEKVEMEVFKARQAACKAVYEEMARK
tara:strand:+ start:1915 stop:2325 length:411 start_codon:yes stop_codon:yes gene_type:complete